MGNLVIPDWQNLAPVNAFQYKVGDINGFTLTAYFPAIADWEDGALRARLQERLREDVASLLRTAEFFNESSLENRKGADYFAVEFKDDIYDFQVAVYQDRIVVRKAGVQLPTFHHWYHAAVPGFKQIFDSILSVLDKERGMVHSVTSVQYNFDFVAYDFVQLGKKLHNYYVLGKLITQVPEESGEIVNIEAGKHSVSRLDYKVNTWDGVGDRRRRFTYAVKAPSNRTYAGLWFELSYGSETYTDPDTQTREWSNPGVLLEEYSRVYDFMWAKGLGGFMRSLLGHLEFKTTASYIP
ncbi:MULTISPECIES: hypothetical protein [unclassified Caulobacter]|uniref:hypothetical protein n=1 Tax=unclassified Caulobacter TaxID=2648921 RepID=UPI0012DDBA4A|nr:hypothetical protein [Caulobacter sp. UNC358MFTsu5.1]